MNDTASHKWPRLYCDSSLSEGSQIIFESKRAHYLGTVLRLKKGDPVRLFNQSDGEFKALLQEISKKQAALDVQERLRFSPTQDTPAIHLAFAPIRQARMDILIEKAVELGVNSLYPVLTHHTVVRKINPERIKNQIIEASEQCERLDIPVLHPLAGFKDLPDSMKILACLERSDAKPLIKALPSEDFIILIGPEGGFSDEERDVLAQNPNIIPVTLGARILRSETAAMAALALASQFHSDQ